MYRTAVFSITTTPTKAYHSVKCLLSEHINKLGEGHMVCQGCVLSFP